MRAGSETGRELGEEAGDGEDSCFIVCCMFVGSAMAMAGRADWEDGFVTASSQHRSARFLSVGDRRFAVSGEEATEGDKEGEGDDAMGAAAVAASERVSRAEGTEDWLSGRAASIM